ncbi:unnamed protein product [Ceutorhynchus assimilis]|uniref:Activating signal cointegrator 1 complex subunit 3 n=1 Tax=Ceutorhynchus assimilis TaxID=467358 RepID=A0A9N9MUJ0_9CUCU|nr:unnamed protein product [Ceutorhynchus assimilis]
MSNFFKIFHGLQQFESPSQPMEFSISKCEYSRIENRFKYAEDVEIAVGLIYLEELRGIVEKHIKAKVKDDLPLEESICENMVQLIKEFKLGHTFNKQLFSREPVSTLEKIEWLIENITERLSNDHFYKAPRSFKLEKIDLDKLSKPINPLFYIPLGHKLPDNTNYNKSDSKNEFSLLYSGAKKDNEIYPLQAMFELNKNSFPSYTYEEFSAIIAEQLTSDRSDDEIVTYLLDIFGCTVFDFLGEIISNRHKNIDYRATKVNNNVKLVKPPPKSTSNAVIAGTVTVQSEKESNLLKKMRKIEKKDRNKGEIKETATEYEAAKNTPLFKKQVFRLDPNEYPHVHDEMRSNMIETKYDGVTVCQPANAIKKNTSQYAEFTIPGSKKDDIDKIPKVQVSSLDNLGKLVFKDIKEFNVIQSEVFPVAYNSNENLLICAPTGAGKTNIALLSIVHRIKCHMEGSNIKKNEFKIVYVCPMKALATEMVENFRKKLAPIGISVKECTGDMQLTKKEIFETQMLVTTPEKWDVITRKGAVDSEIVGLVKLLIIDEVHLLNSSRGPVIETLVARTLRQVVSSQSMIRIVALSATLPGYLDVAQFLKVNTKTGLFFFDNRYRSVPLTTSFIGVKGSRGEESATMDMICYTKVVDFIRDGHQAMIFVTSRNATASVANRIIEIAQSKGTLHLFEPERSIKIHKAGYKTSELGRLVPLGFGIHHAGMVRSDRLAVEHLFRTGELKILVCTTTLAWGVNLPAHAVIIRGTLHYDSSKSSFADMDMLDVQQIFGRAGRPQYDTSGHGLIITSMENMSKYMGLMLSQTPIESQFLNCISDHLNAEVILGTVSNLMEAVEWLSNTFLYCRIKKNPLVYGLTFNEVWDTSQFNKFLQGQLNNAANILEASQMIRFDRTLGELRPTNFGRIASFYYISHKTMDLFSKRFHRHISEANLFKLLGEAEEFKQIQVRMDEVKELERLLEYNEYDIDLPVGTSGSAKVLCLVQAYISRAPIRVSSLISDSNYIMQTIVRLARALFEIAKSKNYALQMSRALTLAQMLEQQMWDHMHPLRQFKELSQHLDSHRASEVLMLNIEDLKEMSERELENLFRSRHVGSRVKHYCNVFPTVDVEQIVQPITEGVIRVKLTITPTFKWDNQIHGGAQHYYAWVEDPRHDAVYHIESFVITKKNCQDADNTVDLVFTVPLTKPLSFEYYVRVVNSQFMHSHETGVIDLENMIQFPKDSYQTTILDLYPLPKNVLKNKSFEELYSFTHFNAVQSQVFHSCYHTDTPIILGAPTGSGKTIVAELCILRLFRCNPNKKVVYIAPMKALVRERVKDWSTKFAKINKKVIEVTGDVTPRSEFIRSADIIITTPEKWDAMSRNWTEKDFVKQVGLMVIDEVHLLGEERGPVLEVIVSRMNCINNKKNTNVRIIGLSTAMANPGDLAYWLNCDKRGLFNFSSAVRPVPLEIHLQGFDVKNYCPRMAAMNKSVYQAICQYAQDSSSLIFVSSRKQTRITGGELMKYVLNENNPHRWIHCHPDELEDAKARIIDQDLLELISYGIGIHHAGLVDSDRHLVEHLFVNQKIQVLIATATLAWGVNFPARLVIVKGTEFFDPTTKLYRDMPITDVIQMCGRAGRPQFDSSGVACVMVEESKKNFYRKFLFEPFPVESNLLESLPDHVNAEIANGNVATKNQLVEFIESTFFFRRLLANPSYYQLQPNDDPLQYVSDLADSVVDALRQRDCVTMPEKDAVEEIYETTLLGMLSSQYYLSYKSIHFLSESMEPNNSIEELLTLICQVEEYKLFPVRHNEDIINREWCKKLDIKTSFPFDSPYLKVLIMLKCYLLNKNLPNQEYILDLKSVLDQIIRIIHAMMSLAATRNWLECTLKTIHLCQMLIQGFMLTSPNLIMLPYVNASKLVEIQSQLGKVLRINNSEINIADLKSSINSNPNIGKDITSIFGKILGVNAAAEIMKTIRDLPTLTIQSIVANATNNTILDLETDKINRLIRITGQEDADYLIKLDMTREGSRNMNVFSKKFNKQKEEFWFLILATENDLIFKKFSFSRRYKTIEVPVHLRRGVYSYQLYIMSDCYLGFDQLLTFRIKIG